MSTRDWSSDVCSSDLDGGQSRSLGLNTSTTYTGLTATSHTVQLNGIPTNCSASEANPQTVTVPAGSTGQATLDRKSTRLNFSHEWIAYAGFCLKKKRG